MAYQTIYYTNDDGYEDSYDIWVDDPIYYENDGTASTSTGTPAEPIYYENDGTSSTSTATPTFTGGGDWVDNGDGTYSIVNDLGQTLTVDSYGNLVSSPDLLNPSTTVELTDAEKTAAIKEAQRDSNANTVGPITGGGIASSGITGILDKAKSIWAGLSDKQKGALLGAGIYGVDKLTGGTLAGTPNGITAGYQGNVPTYAATRVAVPGTYDPNRRPGSTGQRYFSDMVYSDPSGGATANAIATAQASDLAAKNLAARTPQAPVQAAAQGGIMGYAHGGTTGRYLRGGTDGMADELPAQIDETEPAKLSHGEFVIPADVVSHLGNGNSDAGAQKLYSMMDKIRKARTGTTKQGKRINPDKFLPGGIKGFAGGGDVAPSGTIGTNENIASWAGPYVTNLLGQTQAATNQPYQAYQGPLTAGPSALQSQVTGTLQNTAVNPNYGKSFTDTGVQQSYMNPYLSGVMNPQLEELRRQSQITQMGNDAKMVGAGAFGGTRQALLTAENQRNLMGEQNKTVGQGLYNAFTQGQQQFNTEQGQAQGVLGLKGATGAVDQATQQAGITADINQFREERDNPYKMLQFQQSMLQGLPITARQYEMAPMTLIDQLAEANKAGLTLKDILEGK